MIIPPMGEKKKKKDAEKCQHHEFYGRVLLTWQFTVQQGNEGISQSTVSPVYMTPKSWMQGSACASMRGAGTRSTGAGVFKQLVLVPVLIFVLSPQSSSTLCMVTSPQRTMQGAAAVVPTLPLVSVSHPGEPEESLSVE